MHKDSKNTSLNIEWVYKASSKYWSFRPVYMFTYSLSAVYLGSSSQMTKLLTLPLILSPALLQPFSLFWLRHRAVSLLYLARSSPQQTDAESAPLRISLLSSATQFSPHSWPNFSTVFQLRNIAKDFSLIITQVTSNLDANDPSASWRLLLDEANKTTSLAKNRDEILRPLNQTLEKLRMKSHPTTGTATKESFNYLRDLWEAVD